MGEDKPSRAITRYGEVGEGTHDAGKAESAGRRLAGSTGRRLGMRTRLACAGCKVAPKDRRKELLRESGAQAAQADGAKGGRAQEHAARCIGHNYVRP